MSKRPPWPTATLASPLLLFALQGCASPMTTPDADATYPPPGHFPPTKNRLVDGPFRFWRHSLGVYCFSTWGCRVQYGPHAIRDRPSDEWQPTADEVSPGLRARMRGTQGDFRNFEGPLLIEWHDKDRTPRRLEVDLGRVFADGLIRHSVPQADIAPHFSIGDPSIIVEIEDRTVRLHMRTLIPLKAPRDPRNPHTDSTEDLVQVFEQVGEPM